MRHLSNECDSIFYTRGFLKLSLQKSLLLNSSSSCVIPLHITIFSAFLVFVLIYLYVWIVRGFYQILGQFHVNSFFRYILPAIYKGSGSWTRMETKTKTRTAPVAEVVGWNSHGGDGANDTSWPEPWGQRDELKPLTKVEPYRRGSYMELKDHSGDKVAWRLGRAEKSKGRSEVWV